MTPRTNWFLAIAYTLLAACVLLAALIWPPVRTLAYAPLRDWLLPNFFLPAGQSASLAVAAPPALEGWLRAAAAEFEQQNALIDINVVVVRGAEANRQLNAVGTGQPDVWIAEAGWVRAGVGNVPYENEGVTLAHDNLVWVANGADGVGNNPSWEPIYNAVAANPQFSVGLPPVNSVEGWAACLSAAAEYHRATQVSAQQINAVAFREWLKEILAAAPNRQRNARDQLASRPPEVAAGLIWTSDLRRLGSSSLVRQAPVFNVVFDYSYFVRSNWRDLPTNEAQARQNAARQFRDFLLASGAQGELAAAGLERAAAQYAGQVTPADEAALRALQVCWQQ